MEGREKELVRRACAGDRDAYWRLVEPHLRTVFSAARAVLVNTADAEEVAQESLLKALRNICQFRLEAKFSTWLVQIALNESRQRLRKCRKHLYRNLEYGPSDDDHPPGSLTRWPEIPHEALMKIVSVNVGMPREVAWRGMTVRTAIFKEPVDGPVMISKLNLAGDRQADLTVHGGEAKAVYAYPAEHYDFWRRERPDLKFPWGAFGENLTTQGLLEDNLCIGDRLRIGMAILMVTEPRMPCYKLAVRFDADDMVQRFLASGRSGFYFSVIEKGEVSAGQQVELLSRDPSRVTVADISRVYLRQTRDADLVARAMNLQALSEDWKAQILVRAGTR